MTESIKIFFKLLICMFFGLATSNNSFAQKPVSSIETIDYNILYRGYNNNILPAVTNNNGATVKLIGTNCTITRVENEEYYIINPGLGKEATISILLVSKSKTDTISTKHYRVFNLPDPELYFGAAKDGENANLHERRVFAKYPPEIFMNVQFKVTSWTLIVNQDTISGSGNILENVDSIFKQIKSPTSIKIITTVKGPDEKIRSIYGEWTVPAWTEPEKVNSIKGCG